MHNWLALSQSENKNAKIFIHINAPSQSIHM